MCASNLLQAINRPKPPPYLAAQFDGDKYEKAQAYSRDKMRMGFWQTLYSTSETIVVLAAGGLPWLWARSGDLLQRVGLNGYEAGTTGGEIAQTVVFVIAFSAFSMVTSLPWSVYSTFVVEAKHGFNKQTPALFVTDVVKSALLGLALAPPIVAGMTYILIHRCAAATAWRGFFLCLKGLCMCGAALCLQHGLTQPACLKII